MRKLVLGLLGFFAVTHANATFLILRDASSLSRGKLANERLDPSSVTLYGPNIPTSALSGSILVSQISGIGSSTFAYHLTFDGPLYLSTNAPVATYSVNKTTFNIVGWQACVARASSSSATMLELAFSTGTPGVPSPLGVGGSPGQYAVNWTAQTFKLEITTQARCSIYQSTGIVVPQDTQFGVRVASTTDSRSTTNSGLPPESLDVSIFGWENRNTSW